MIRRWPDTLPPASIPGFTIRPRDQARRTDMEVGPKRVRRLSRAELEIVTAPYIFDAAQMSAFKDWYYDRRVSLAGPSDSLAGWNLTQLTRSAGAATAPDLIAADRLLETTAESEHYAGLPLPETAANGLPILVRASLRAAGRDKARLILVDRAGLASAAVVDLAAGQLLARSGSLTAALVEPREGGWWRVTAWGNSGTGTGTPALRVGPLDGAGASTYAGNAALGIEVCEVQARIPTGQDLFIPSDDEGFALGAAGGTAWFRIALATDGREVSAEARMDAMWNAQLTAALSGEVTLTMEVRNA